VIGGEDFSGEMGSGITDDDSELEVVKETVVTMVNAELSLEAVRETVDSLLVITRDIEGFPSG
jgi:hypothetical protein